MPSILGHPTDREFDLYRDGTAVFSASSASWSTLNQWSQTNIMNANDWNLATSSNLCGQYTSGRFAIIFPEGRTITAYSFAFNTSGYSVSDIETSDDALSPDTGNWTLRHSGAFHSPWLNLSDISQVRVPLAVSWSNVKAIRFTASTGGNGGVDIYEMHFWGSHSQAGLVFYDEILDQLIDASTFDFGEIEQGTINDRHFRIKNNSAQIANDVVLSVGGNGTGSLPANITYSNGGAFSTTLNVGNIAPGVISSVLTVRRTVASNAALQYGASRLIATATSWT